MPNSNSQPAIELIFHPSLTVSPDQHSGRAAQVVVSLMIRDTHFVDLAKLAWVAAIRCHVESTEWAGRDTPIWRSDSPLQRPATLGKPIPEVDTDGDVTVNGVKVFNKWGLRERLRVSKTLARSTSGAPLDFKAIEVLLANLKVILRGFDDNDASLVENLGYFPMVPGLVLYNGGFEHADFRTFQSRDSVFEDCLDDAIAQIWGHAQPGSVQASNGRARGACALAELAFEQYFDRLISLVNDLFDRRCEKWFRENPSESKRRVGDVLDDTNLEDFRNVMAQITADFYSGLRLPERFDDGTKQPVPPFDGFFAWTGQQFSLPSNLPSGPNVPYVIELIPRLVNPVTWLTLDSDPRKPRTTTLNTDELSSYLTQPLPTNLSTLEAISPVEASDRHFGFSPSTKWTEAGGQVRMVWPMPGALRREIRTVAAELRTLYPDPGLDSYDLINIALTVEQAGESNSNYTPNVAFAGARWASTVPLMIRQVADTTKPAPGSNAQGQITPVNNLYELVGMSEADRRMLDALVEEWATTPPVSVHILYPDAVNGWNSDSLDTASTSTECLLLRTNLTTESAPNSALRANQSIRGADIASIGSADAFVRLIDNACIVNSGGYFLRYEPVNGADPLRDLFKSGASDQKQTIMLVVLFNEVEASPHPRPYYTAVVAAPQPPARQGADMVVTAVVERAQIVNGNKHWYRLIQHEVRFAPGTVGFQASRPRIPDPGQNAPSAAQAAFSLDRLFNRLGYSVETPTSTDFKKFPITLPIQPHEPGCSFSGAPPIQADDTNWHWRHAVQVLADPFETPYSGVGQDVKICTMIRDIYGNEFPSTGAHSVISTRLVYFDKLIGISEWPSVKAKLIAVGSSRTRQITVEISGYPYGIGGSSVSIPEKMRVIDRFLAIKRQLYDPNVSCELCVRSQYGGVSGTTAKIDCRTILRSFVDEVLSRKDEICPKIITQIAVGNPTIDCPVDFFQLEFSVDIRRQGQDDHFAQICFPWESPDGTSPAPNRVFSAARLATSRVSLPESASDSESSLITFAKAFEAIYAPSRLKLAVAEGDESERTLWVIRRDRLEPTISRYRPPVGGNDLVFAARPLSTRLLWRSVTDVPSIDLSNPEVITKSEVKFTDVDLDARARDCLASIQRFLEPTTISNLVKSYDSMSDPAQDGWLSFQTIMDAKRRLSGQAPEELLTEVFQTGPQPGVCVREAAVSAFRQSALTTLNAIYGVDAILPFDVASPASMTSSELGGGVALYGQIKDDAGPNDVLNYRNNKIRYRPARLSSPACFVAVIDQPPPPPNQSRKQAGPRTMTFIWTHVEFELPLPQKNSTGCYKDVEFPQSRWLVLLLPIEVQIAGAQPLTVPMPIREFPKTPRVLNHTAQPPRSPSTIRKARNWSYLLTYAAVMESGVDELEVRVQLNVPLPPPDGTLLAGMTDLFDSVMRFHAAFPRPDDAFAVLRTSLGSVDPSRIRQGLLIAAEWGRRTKDVADAFSGLHTPIRALRTGPVLRDVFYTAKEEDLGSNGRRAQVNWLAVDDDVPAEIKPEYDPGISSTAVTHGRKTEFIETIGQIDLPEGWRNRRLVMGDLNAMKYESCQSWLKLVRNRHLLPPGGSTGDDTYLVREAFVYSTPETSPSRPVVAGNDITERIPIVIQSADPTRKPSLTDHLSYCFSELFSDLPADADKRRLRLEIKYSFPAKHQADPIASDSSNWAADFSVRSAQRLLPPKDIDISNQVVLIADLVANLKIWKDTQFDPDRTGELVADVQVYSILSETDRDRPLVRIRNICIPLSSVEIPWT